MLKVIFWNIAHLKNVLDKGQVSKTEVFSGFENTLLGIVNRDNPDLVVLCEGYKGFRKNMREAGVLPRGYEFVKPDKNSKDINGGGYTDQHTLRYVVMARTGLAYDAFYISMHTYNFTKEQKKLKTGGKVTKQPTSNKNSPYRVPQVTKMRVGDTFDSTTEKVSYTEYLQDRPAVIINLVNGNKRVTLAALHASSAGPKTVTPQSANVFSVLEHAHTNQLNYTINNVDYTYAPPTLVFGDINVNARDGVMMPKVSSAFDWYKDMLGTHVDVGYTIKKPPRPTHGDTTLDWVLARNEIATKVVVTNVVDEPEHDMKKPVPKKTEDDDFRLPIQTTTKSDHGAIVITLNDDVF